MSVPTSSFPEFPLTSPLSRQHPSQTMRYPLFVFPPIHIGEGTRLGHGSRRDRGCLHFHGHRDHSRYHRNAVWYVFPNHTSFQSYRGAQVTTMPISPSIPTFTISKRKYCTVPDVPMGNQPLTLFPLRYMFYRLPEGGQGMSGYDDGEGDD